MYTLSGHKIMGPKGIGALWVRRGVRLLPRQIGGGQEGEYRSGTENTPGIAGLLAAIQTMDPQAPAAMMAMKLRLAQGLLQRVPGLVINGPDPKLGAPHILNASFPGVRGEVMLHAWRGRCLRIHRFGLLVQEAQGERRAFEHGHSRRCGRGCAALQPGGG